MKKLIVTDLVWICGSDLIGSGIRNFRWEAQMYGIWQSFLTSSYVYIFLIKLSYIMTSCFLQVAVSSSPVSLVISNQPLYDNSNFNILHSVQVFWFFLRFLVNIFWCLDSIPWVCSCWLLFLACSNLLNNSWCLLRSSIWWSCLCMPLMQLLLIVRIIVMICCLCMFAMLNVCISNLVVFKLLRFLIVTFLIRSFLTLFVILIASLMQLLIILLNHAFLKHNDSII